MTTPTRLAATAAGTPTPRPTRGRPRGSATRTARRQREAASGALAVIGYTRVSTEEQVDSRAGLDAQETAIRDEGNRRGWAVELLSDPGRTGKVVNKELRRALELLASGQADALVVAKMDRIARSARAAMEIIDQAQEQGWALIILDMNLDMTTPAGRAMARMLAVFAEFESDMISTRTREGMAAKARAGVQMGRPRLAPPGVVRRIVLSRDSGASFDEIARALEAEAVLSPAGRRNWQPSTVRRIYNSATPPLPLENAGIDN